MNKKILIIEDEKTVRENVVFLLTEEGYTVYSASNGKEGVVLIKKEVPDLIICDIMMDGMDGYEVLNTIAKDPVNKSIPFIFLTAKVEKEDIRLGMNLGADDYLFKPFDADDLLKSIESRLKRIEILKEDNVPGKDNSTPDHYTLDDKLFVQVNKKTFIINITDIVSINAEKQYSSLITNDGKSYLLRKSISHWEKILPEKKFLRIHRSTVINIEYLIKIESWFNSSYIVYLKNLEKPYIISRRYSIKLKSKLFK